MLLLDARPGDLVDIRGERWRVARCIAYGDAVMVEAVGRDAGNRGIHSRFLLPFEPMHRAVVSDAPRAVRPAEWRLTACRILADATPSWTALRTATRANLDIVAFQLEPALALLRGEGCRFLIADAVGLGKTVQAGLMMAELLERQPDARVIVVAPAGLREQWRLELRSRFAFNASVMDAAGVARAASTLPVGLNPWSAHRLVITSIDYVKRPEVMRCLETLVWDMVVIDEAHTVSGRSDRAVAAAALANRGRSVVMLTATPHSGDAEAFRRMCDMGRHHDADALLLFSRAHADAGLTHSRRTRLLRVQPTPAERAMHAALQEYTARVWREAQPGPSGAKLAMCVLARRASSSAGALAASIQRRLSLLRQATASTGSQLDLPFDLAALDDETPGLQLGGRGLADADEEAACLIRIQQLAHGAAQHESKLRVIQRLVARISEPMIVFTEYRDTLDRIASVLSGVATAHLHGGLSLRQRADVLSQFTEGVVRVLLATDAAAEGLNLHHRCRLVINLELPWTPLRLEQRVGRVDRIGQQRRVHAIHLVARFTKEETVLTRLAERMRTVRAVLGTLAYSPLPSHDQVADAVFGGTALSDAFVPVAVADDRRFRIVDLTRESRAEAARIERTRAFLRRAGATTDEGRATITMFSKRKTSRRQCFWVFRLSFVAEDGRGLWDELLPFTGSCRSAMVALPRTPAAVRRLLDPRRPELQRALTVIRDERLAAFALDVRAHTQPRLHREETLARSLQQQHARLSAGLVQLGLFDRRAERLASAQSALLDEALASSGLHRAQLTAATHPRLDACDLLLAVAVE